jgi:hypothetical protein
MHQLAGSQENKELLHYPLLEVEYMTLTEGSKKAVYLQGLVMELFGEEYVIALYNNPVLRKSIELLRKFCEGSGAGLAQSV